MMDLTGLRELLDADEYSEAPTADGGVKVEAHWGPARLKMTCYRDRVHYGTLESGSEDAAGLYTWLCDMLPNYFAARGVEKFTATPNMENLEFILRRGDWRPVPDDPYGYYEWPLKGTV